MMIQYNTGITSTLKKDQQFCRGPIKPNNKKIQQRFKPKCPKTPNFPKQNAVFNHTSGSKKFIAVEESCKKLPQETKPKTNPKNHSRKELKVNNDYLNEHLMNGVKRKSVKIQNLGNSQQIELSKHTKNQSKPSKTIQQPSKNIKKFASTFNLSSNIPEKTPINDEFTEKSNVYNKKLFQNEYKQQKEQDKPKLKLGNRIRPQRSISSSSGQSKNSYYGIVAEYRKRRLQSQDSFDGKNSFQNSVSLSGSGHTRRMINRVKLQDNVHLSGLFNETQQTLEKKFEWKRPRIGTSVSSKESIKSSQSNLSQSTRNPFEQKVVLMRQHLKLRKGKINFSNQKLNPLSLSNRIQNPFKNTNEGQSFLIENRVQYRPQIAESQSEVKKYKELYKISLEKVKNVERQLEVQKKKNELTKNIFKAEIDKLKRTKSFETFNSEKQQQEKTLKVFERIDTAEGDYPKGVKIFLKTNLRQDNKNKIDQLKDKLKNSHLFSYQDYQGVTATANKSIKPSSLSQKQPSAQSILVPSEQLLAVDNTSNDMIVEMSSQWMQSGLFGSSFARSKLASSRQSDNNLQEKETENAQFSFKKIYYCRNDSIRDKSKDEINDWIKDESMLLDISSNLNQTKGSKSYIEANNSQQNCLNLLQSEELVSSQTIIVECIKDSTPKSIKNQAQYCDYQKPNSKGITTKAKTSSGYPKILQTRKDFAQDMTKRTSQSNYQSEYQSTQSSTRMKSRYNIYKKNFFSYK